MTRRDQRFVVDTNVLISAALFPHSRPGRALRLILATGTLLESPATLAELAEVIGRPKLDRYLTWDERELFLMALADRAELAEPTTQLAVSRDPDDDRFLELAVDGQATLIISGDPHLLDLSPFKGIPVITADAFLRLHGS